MSEDPRVSVVVAARNADRDIGRLLDALESQSAAREDFELIVFDDGSTDRTAAVVEERGWPTVIRADRPMGAPAARNLAVERARAELIAVTDADCVPDRDWIAAGVRRFAADASLERLGGAIEVTLPEPPTIAALVDAARFLDQERMVAMGFAISANFWVRRGAFLAAGGFNPELRPNAQEDAELGRVMSARNSPIAYAPDVRVAHPARATVRALAQKGYRLGRAHATLRRHARVGGVWLRPYFLRRKAFVPIGSWRRIGRLHARGIHPTRWQRARMVAVETACISCAHVIGDLVGTARMGVPQAPRGRPAKR